MKHPALPPNQDNSASAQLLIALQAMIDEAIEKRANDLLTPIHLRIKLIENGLDKWVGTKVALAITGLKEPETLINRAKAPDSLIEWKFNENGSRYLFLRSSLVAYVKANPPRRYRP